MGCHYSKRCILCFERYSCKIYLGIKVGYTAIRSWDLQTVNIIAIEKKLAKLYNWREIHVKKLDNIKNQDTASFEYSMNRLLEIEEEIQELEVIVGSIQYSEYIKE